MIQGVGRDAARMVGAIQQRYAKRGPARSAIRAFAVSPEVGWTARDGTRRADPTAL
jgi:hypothetical protein